jgi:4-hydroxymandelate oxidase
MDSRDFDALENEAYRRMTAGAAAFVQCGADDEITTAENAKAWRSLRLRPRVLRDICEIDVSTVVLGQRVGSPLMVAPMGRHKAYHAQGEAATARGAAMAGAIFVEPTNATVSIEEVAAERGEAPQWFQLYLPPDGRERETLVERVQAAGYGAIMLTVDQPVGGSAPRAAREPIPASDELRHVNLPGAPPAATAYDPLRTGVLNYPTTWRDLEWLVKRTPLPIVVKGVLRDDDAVRCVGLGVRGVLVSNHGGRHLDTAVTTVEALPEVVGAVGRYADVYVDGGIRRGTDILKALAMGARAVLIGRPVLWGLAIDGAEGVCSVLRHLEDELRRAMALAGVPSVAEATGDLVAWGKST